MAKLGRGKVCAIYAEGVELPSDFQGVVYIPLDAGGAWRMLLTRELKASGLDIDLNNAL
jgi:predicted nucleotide-binding protein